MICRPAENTQDVKKATDTLKKVLTALAKIDPTRPPTESQLLSEANVTENDYYGAMQVAFKRETIVMKRTTSETCVNNYNAVILKALQANMDIKYITNVWACIAYLTSYMCKPERTMSELMKKACKEADDKNIQNKLHHIGQVFLKCREVSEHEAIARILSLPLRRSNTKVIFIPTGPKEQRTRMLKPINVIAEMDDQDDDVYVSSLLDKYAARPDCLEDASLAYFCANYVTRPNTDTTENEEEQLEVDESVTAKKVHLKNNLGIMYKRIKPCVLRYHSVSKNRDPELFHFRLLLLYYPWRQEESLLHADGSWTSKYKEVSDQILPTIQAFEPFYEDIENADIDFDEGLWADPELEPQETAHHIDAQFAGLNPDLLEYDQVPSDAPAPRCYAVHASTTFSPDSQYYDQISSLNDEQYKLFCYIFQWSTDVCQSTLTDVHPDPFYIFLSGGAGVGKSHLIHAIYQGAIRALRQPGQNPDQPTVLLTASTGKAAANINGTTLHSAFNLPVRQRGKAFQYRKSSDEKLNTMRAMYQNLKVIIIDEISMVGGSTLEHLSLALQDIFGNDKPFGGVSILAVGDLFQLPPCGDRAVFQTPKLDYNVLCGSIWKQHFQLYELTTIVRQRADTQFAEILSRIRVGDIQPQDMEELAALQHTDVSLLPPNTLHLFFTNDQANKHNQEMLQKSDAPHITVTASDSRKDLQTGSCDVTITSNNIHETGGLRKTLQLCEGARWIQTKNTDLSDHLVNGATGTIVKLHISPSNPLGGIIYVQFDDDKAGINSRRHNPPHLKHAVPVRAVTARFPLSPKSPVMVERKQYPGMLAWALTAHKAQGSTCTHIIADLSMPPKVKSPPPGLTYTIISRATTRQGVKLINFTPDKIKVNNAALQEIVRMRNSSVFEWEHPLMKNHTEPIIAHLNIRSWNSHYRHIIEDPLISKCTILGLSETHTSPSSTNLAVPGDKWQVVHHHTQHGLALLLHSTTASIRQLQLPSSHLQCLPCIVNVEHHSCFILIVYRPPGPLQGFTSHMDNFLTNAPVTQYSTYIMGDFNMDLSAKQQLEAVLHNHGFSQLITIPTLQRGGILDLIFTNTPQSQHGVSPISYTDHFIIWTTATRHP